MKLENSLHSLPLHMNLRTIRILGDVNSSTTEQVNYNVNSDLVLILAALLCALICVLGLVAVARCAWSRRISASPPPQQNKGLNKEVLNSLPKLAYTADDEAGKLSDCAICLTEFAVGDEIRVLPNCGHGFHVGCIDTWLGSHSSCPSCRQFLVAAQRCHKCGGSVAGAETPAAARLGQRIEDNVIRFLP